MKNNYNLYLSCILIIATGLACSDVKMLQFLYLSHYTTITVSLFIPFIIFGRNLFIELYGYNDYRKIIIYCIIFLGVIFLIKSYTNIYDDSNKIVLLIFILVLSLSCYRVTNFWWLKLLKPLFNSSTSPFILSRFGISVLQMVIFTIFFNLILLSCNGYDHLIINKIVLDSVIINLLLCFPFYIIERLILIFVKMLLISSTSYQSNKDSLFDLIYTQLEKNNKKSNKKVE